MRLDNYSPRTKCRIPQKGIPETVPGGKTINVHVKNQYENILNRAEHVGSNQKAIRKSLRCTD